MGTVANGTAGVGLRGDALLSSAGWASRRSRRGRTDARGNHGTPGAAKDAYGAATRSGKARSLATPENPWSGRARQYDCPGPFKEDPVITTRYRVIKLRGGWGVVDTVTGNVWTGMVHVGAVSLASRLNHRAS